MPEHREPNVGVIEEDLVEGPRPAGNGADCWLTELAHGLGVAARTMADGLAQLGRLVQRPVPRAPRDPPEDVGTLLRRLDDRLSGRRAEGIEALREDRELWQLLDQLQRARRRARPGAGSSPRRKLRALPGSPAKKHTGTQLKRKPPATDAKEAAAPAAEEADRPAPVTPTGGGPEQPEGLAMLDQLVAEARVESEAEGERRAPVGDEAKELQEGAHGRERRTSRTRGRKEKEWDTPEDEEGHRDTEEPEDTRGEK